ncbi:hypothetical protein [Inquilinus sp. CAU 1745]|uniref:hypothetical protein n=1 Tax=Inquilinus sp. CAU 1745 TaxID=3140369 RepID=UPI00325AD59C
MALSAIALANRALLKLGASAIHGFDDPTAEAEVAGALYGPARDALLSDHPWAFATRTARLAALEEGGFQLPSDMLRALSAGLPPRARGLDYRIEGRRLLADAPGAVLIHIFRPPETDTPPFFETALIARLAAEMCIPLTENTSRAETLAKWAEAELRRARLIDSQQDSPPRFEDFTLIDVRFGRMRS